MGQSGSGKTTLAEKISKKLSIPHIHLDDFYFAARDERTALEDDKEDYVKTNMREKVLAAFDAASWVSDGFYSRILPEIPEKADIIVLLDISLWRRLLNHMKRSLSPATRHREASVWHDFAYFFEMIRRTPAGRQKIKKLIKNYRGKTIILKSRYDIDTYIRNLN